MSKIIRSDMDFHDPNVTTLTRVEQIPKQWSVIIENLINGESLAFIYPSEFVNWNWHIERINSMTIGRVNELIYDKYSALVKMTRYDISQDDDKEDGDE